ncbi:hypothetical protein NNC19_02745 [Clostridium sp. SHJSY1]|uniref:hypothetical protein n=1 Tax=Clostridium sp. SHJSY1 TaxID=2942483 RepID=UPI002875FC26|nr:hypothetical protein [Clostridium sp. SHJSY1]MDS0524580.1 hypothetical protein [Clostridium sp. SHJSY1]
MIFDSVGLSLRKIRKNRLLNDKIEIKINYNEKILFLKYAKTCGLNIDDLIKGLVREEIDKFIKG